MIARYQIAFFISEQEKDVTEKLKKDYNLSHHDIYARGLESYEATLKKEVAREKSKKALE